MITENQYRRALEQRESADLIINEYHAQKAKAFEERWERWKKGEAPFIDEELIYSAHDRCSCGAGLAYPKTCGPGHQWTCADVLTYRVKTNEHHLELPFAFYNIKEDFQPSACGATTRPKPSDSKTQ